MKIMKTWTLCQTAEVFLAEAVMLLNWTLCLSLGLFISCCPYMEVLTVREWPISVFVCYCVLTLSSFECALQHELKISVSSFLVCKKLRCCTFKMCWQENGDGHLLGLRRRFLFNTKKINTRNLNIKFVYRYHSFLSVKAAKYWSGPFTFFLIFYTI